jgi:chemotaxis protein CheZ
MALKAYIDRARQDLASLGRAEESKRHFVAATDELDAVVKATEVATGTILDAAESLQNLTNSISSEHAAIVVEATTKIFEACNFQDITGQRISKVVAALHAIESKVEGIVATLLPGDAMVRADRRPSTADAPATAKTMTDDDLLNGPQLPDKAKKQKEIEELFASLK